MPVIDSPVSAVPPRAAPVHDPAARFRGGPWISLVPVITAVVALTALAAIPWTASWRLAALRLNTAETIAPARQLVRDIAQALALEAAARNPAATRAGAETARYYDAAVAVEAARDSALGALAPRMDNALAGDIAQLRGLTARWRAQRDATAPTGSAVTLAEILGAASRVDSAIASRQTERSTRIRSLESMDVLVPTVLVPLLLIVLLAIFWTGRRMAALAKEAERSRRALAFASEQRVTLLRGLTHDLKNSLGAAAGYARLLEEGTAGPLAPLQRDYIKRIGRIMDDTIGSVEDTLTVARTEAASLPVRRHPEDLRALVLEAASDYVATAERAGLALTVEFAEDLPTVDTDSSLVSKIIGNLLSNAIKYTPHGGKIWLRGSALPPWDTPGETGSWAVIEVSDTGPGIPPALREKVFDEFFRAPAAATAARGQGIGLAMSRRVARLLGGEITLESDEGWGATFALWLPGPPRDVIMPKPVSDIPPRRRASEVFDRRAVQ